MLNYHFTNDTRFEQIELNLYAVAKYFYEGIWEHPTQTYEQAKNGWFQVYELYFGLYKDAVNVQLILNNKSNAVISEFVKKFQFPNPRKVKNNGMQKEINNKQLLAPLRTLLQLLFYLKMKNKKSEVTFADFEKYILLNDEAAKNEIDIEKIFYQLTNRELDGEDKEYEYSGGDKERFVKQIVGFMKPLPFVNVQSDRISIVTESISETDKSLFFDILNYNEFWHIDDVYKPQNELEKSYKDYMQVSVNKNDVSSFEYDNVHNVIYYGAPGTGKSFEITKKIRGIYPNFEDENNIESNFVFRTTLHPDYSYSDFIGQIMPEITKEKTQYKFFAGVFTRALKKAISVEKKRQPVFLILEELSRANSAAVFGDLFQLLDRKEGKSEYSITNSQIAEEIYKNASCLGDIKDKKISLPSNFYIYCTVNTNDQNVFAMDTAFKRRFDWIYISTAPINKENNPLIYIFDQTGFKNEIYWHLLYQKLNTYITKEMGLEEDKQIGQFFIKFENSSEVNKKKIKNKLLQYLWEDIEKVNYNNKNKIFSTEIANFSDLYLRFENDERIFSQEFLDYIKDSWSQPNEI